MFALRRLPSIAAWSSSSSLSAVNLRPRGVSPNSTFGIFDHGSAIHRPSHPRSSIRTSSRLIHTNECNSWISSTDRPDPPLPPICGPAWNADHPSSSLQSACTSRNLVFPRYSSSSKSLPPTILIVKKPNDQPTEDALDQVLTHIHQAYPRTRVLLESSCSETLPKAFHLKHPYTECFVPSLASSNPPDLVITLGGDGTILHVSSLFNGPLAACPPILSFSMGSLGFLLPFHINSFKEALADVYEGRSTLLDRMRLAVDVFDENGKLSDRCGDQGCQVMNEVALHRGRYPHLAVVDIFVDNQFLTESVADGLLLATPTGSTAYSLSSGGPILHPSLSSTILLTPISPRSLSFRPLLLPSSSSITLRISENSRAPVELTMDGREVGVLKGGEGVRVGRSLEGVPCVRRGGEGDDWVGDINTLLQFNASFKNKALIRHGPSSKDQD